MMRCFPVREASLALLAIIVAGLGAAPPAHAAERYAVSLTRKSSNFYKVDGQSIWVQTRYCYVYGYGELASLGPYDVEFKDSDDKCDVRRVLQQADVTPGAYKVQVTQEADDLYSTLEGTFIRTSMCLNLAIGQEAVVRIGVGGYGTLRFRDDGEECTVEAVLTQLRI